MMLALSLFAVIAGYIVGWRRGFAAGDSLRRRAGE